MYRYIFDGGFLMIPLLCCSVYALTWSCHKFIAILLYKHRPSKSFISMASKKILKNSTLGQSFHQEFQHYNSHLYQLCIKQESDKIEEWIEKKVIQNQSQLIFHNHYLEFIIRCAPILGILGTVIGIIITFQGIDMSSIESFDIILRGISQALNTTAYGLFIAIFSILSLNSFNHFIEKKMDLERQQLNLIIRHFISDES